MGKRKPGEVLNEPTQHLKDIAESLRIIIRLLSTKGILLGTRVDDKDTSID